MIEFDSYIFLESIPSLPYLKSILFNHRINSLKQYIMHCTPLLMAYQYICAAVLVSFLYVFII